jgi:hypothetical protein
VRGRLKLEGWILCGRETYDSAEDWMTVKINWLVAQCVVCLSLNLASWKLGNGKQVTTYTCGRTFALVICH